MKKTTKILLVIGMMSIPTLITLSSYKSITDKSTATVDQKEGLYIFVMSKPVSETEYLGSVKKISALSLSTKPEAMLNGIIKKVKKDYPNADAVIFTTIDMDKADAVKFK